MTIEAPTPTKHLTTWHCRIHNSEYTGACPDCYMHARQTIGDQARRIAELQEILAVATPSSSTLDVLMELQARVAKLEAK